MALCASLHRWRPSPHRHRGEKFFRAELGFVVDSDVMVVSEIARNLIVQVRDSRIALDKSMASRIMV